MNLSAQIAEMERRVRAAAAKQSTPKKEPIDYAAVEAVMVEECGPDYPAELNKAITETMPWMKSEQ